MALHSVAVRSRSTSGLGFTLIEVLVSVLLVSLFFLSYLEWASARANSARQLLALEQMEQVRRAVLAFAVDTRRRSFLSVESPVWPHDNVGEERIYNRGMVLLLRGGYLDPAFAAVYPGTRWVFDTILGPTAALWLKVRYEAPQSYGYGRDFQVLAGAFSQWSRYRESVDCSSDLAHLGAAEGAVAKCTAVEFYLVRGTTAGPTSESPFWIWLKAKIDAARERALCIDQDFLDDSKFDADDCENADADADDNKFDRFNLKFINFDGGSLKRIRRLIVGGRPGQNYRYESGQPLVYEEHAEQSGLQNNLDLLDGPADGNFANALAKWNEKIGNDRDFNNHIVLNNATHNFKYAGTPVNVNNGQHKKDARYLTHLSGLYADNLHLGHSWSEPVRARNGYSIKEMPIGTGLTRHYWTASGIPKLPGWWPHPAGSHQKFYFPDHSPAPYENQPYYNASANSDNGSFESSFNITSGRAVEKEFPAYNYLATPDSTPTGEADRQIARDFTAINIGYAGFNKAILGAYGLYTSNLVLGDRNSAYNKRTIKYGCKYGYVNVNGAVENHGVHNCAGNWPAHDEGLISYFTEFRFRNVRIEVGNTGLRPEQNQVNTWSCARRTGLIQVRTANANQQGQLDNFVADSERLFRLKTAESMIHSARRKITGESAETLNNSKRNANTAVNNSILTGQPAGYEFDDAIHYFRDIRDRYIRGVRGYRFIEGQLNEPINAWHNWPSGSDWDKFRIHRSYDGITDSYTRYIDSDGRLVRIDNSNTILNEFRRARNAILEARELTNGTDPFNAAEGFSNTLGELNANFITRAPVYWFRQLNVSARKGRWAARNRLYSTYRGYSDQSAVNVAANMLSGIARNNSQYLTLLNTHLVNNRVSQGMLNWISHNCNHEHDRGKINAGAFAPRPSSSLGPVPQTAWQNFSDVGFMNGLLRRSDARLKKNIRPLQVRAGALEQIRLWSFSRKDDPSEREQLGFVAQEVNAHYPELVRTDKNGYLSMSYDGMVPVLWGHLDDWKRTHNARVQNMKAREQDIDARLKLLEQQAADEQ